MLMVGDVFSSFILGEEIHPRSDAFPEWLMKRTYEEQRLRGGRFALGAMFAALPT